MYVFGVQAVLPDMLPVHEWPGPSFAKQYSDHRPVVVRYTVDKPQVMTSLVESEDVSVGGICQAQSTRHTWPTIVRSDANGAALGALNRECSPLTALCTLSCEEALKYIASQQ